MEEHDVQIAKSVESAIGRCGTICRVPSWNVIRTEWIRFLSVKVYPDLQLCNPHDGRLAEVGKGAMMFDICLIAFKTSNPADASN